MGIFGKLKILIFKHAIGTKPCTSTSRTIGKPCTIVAERPTGSGTDRDPFILSTLGHLVWLSRNGWCWNAAFRQIKDIDAGKTRSLEGEFSPIGSSSIPFVGTYDGSGHIISGLSISEPETDYQGFFGMTMNACICNLGLPDVNMKGLNNVGGVVGYMNGGYIRNCYATGSVLGCYYVGGICGKADFPDISDCYATVAVNGGYFCGGLVGKSHAGIITRSYSTGCIFSAAESEYSGGFIGHNVGNSTVIDRDIYNSDFFTDHTKS